MFKAKLTGDEVNALFAGAPRADLHAEARLLHLGARGAVCEVRLWTEPPDVLAAHPTVAYIVPAS